MTSATWIILGFFIVMMSIGGTALYFSSPSVQKKYNPDNR